MKSNYAEEKHFIAFLFKWTLYQLDFDVEEEFRPKCLQVQFIRENGGYHGKYKSKNIDMGL